MIDSVYWYTLKKSEIKKLGGSITCDVAIVGGGMAGLMCAHELVKDGKSVVILERDFVGGGASGKSSGFITPDSELELSDLYDSFRAEDAKKLWNFVTTGVDDIRKNIQQYNISCDYQQQDCLFVGNGKKGFDTVSYEHEVRLKLGYESKFNTKNEIASVIGSEKYSGGVQYGGTFGMNSYLYCQGMKQVLLDAGVQIFEASEVTNITEGNVTVGEFSINAKEIVICADYGLADLNVNVPEVYHAQTFLAISKPLRTEQIKQIFPYEQFMVWDTDLIYQYYRLTGDNRLLLGGADVLYTYGTHASNNTKSIQKKLSKYLEKHYPNLNIDFEYLWPGLIGVSKDFLPLAGLAPNSSNIYYVAAAAGLPWAAALGKYIAQKITTGKHDMDAYFTAERKFALGKKAQSILKRPITFALAHGYEKFLK